MWAGCQRFEVAEAPAAQQTELKWEVRVLADAPTPRLPRPVVRDGAGYWAPWAWRACDAWSLADTARRLFADVAPEVCHRASYTPDSQPCPLETVETCCQRSVKGHGPRAFQAPATWSTSLSEWPSNFPCTSSCLKSKDEYHS